MVVAIYPKVLLDQDMTSSLVWIQKLLLTVLKEYKLFYVNMTNRDKVGEETNGMIAGLQVPDASMFNESFRIIFQQCESLGRERKLMNEGELIEEERTKPSPDKITQTFKVKSKKGKENRVWHDSTQKVTSKSMAALDRSRNKDVVADDDLSALREARAAYLPAEDEKPLWEIEENNTLLDKEDDDDDTSGKSWGSSIKGMLNQLSGNKVLKSEDLEQPLAAMHKLLTTKNVASDIASEICNNVKERLVGRKLTSLTRVKTAVRQALELTIERILRPGKDSEVDLLRAVVTKRERGVGRFFTREQAKRPFVIVMVGINGVGKSTSLAKIAYYLKSNSCNPLLAACDTFRSGAVEQLNVHAKCLNVSLYKEGYAKDPAAVAKAAIDHAAKEGHDVVLVDTAGRMQNNVPLMKALSSLVVQNVPDLVLFVCEALVGNDGMDQLAMFNKALRSGGHSRKIDGIILTKYDTVSDKVGAALTMTHVTGAPVVFVGTGQKYNHLMKLSTQSVIKSLFA